MVIIGVGLWCDVVVVVNGRRLVYRLVMMEVIGENLVEKKKEA
jgi:hypothetical protein